MKTINPAESYLSSGDYLAVVRDFALSKGISLQTLLEGSNFSLEDLINPPAYVNNLVNNRLGANLYRQLENPTREAAEFGLRMTASTHGSLGLAIQCAPNLREAYSFLHTFFHTRVGSEDIYAEEEGDYVVLSLISKMEHQPPASDIQHFFDFATLISIATNTFSITDHQTLDGSIIIQIDREEPSDFPYHKFTSIDFKFNQTQLTLSMPKAWLDTPLSIANPDMAKVALEKCENELQLLTPKDLVTRVKSRLQQNPEALPSLDELAQEFNMSAATFKRKLKDQDTSYQELKNTERLAYATKLMQFPDETIEVIAEKLGFSDASNFTKAFKTWTGKTPKEFRNK